jgi:hypothetical protein
MGYKLFPFKTLVMKVPDSEMSSEVLKKANEVEEKIIVLLSNFHNKLWPGYI